MQLAAAGAKVVIHDPMSLAGVRVKHPELDSVQDLTAAAKDAELVVLGTEWKIYRELDAASFGELVAKKTVIDGRNALPYHAWQEAGWKVIALGRNLENA